MRSITPQHGANVGGGCWSVMAINAAIRAAARQSAGAAAD
jgi:hypothetical protein